MAQPTWASTVCEFYGVDPYWHRDRRARHACPTVALTALTELRCGPEFDTQVNKLGIKGVGELGNVGMNAAAANAGFSDPQS